MNSAYEGVHSSAGLGCQVPGVLSTYSTGQSNRRYYSHPPVWVIFVLARYIWLVSEPELEISMAWRKNQRLGVLCCICLLSPWSVRIWTVNALTFVHCQCRCNYSISISSKFKGRKVKANVTIKFHIVISILLLFLSFPSLQLLNLVYAKVLHGADKTTYMAQSVSWLESVTREWVEGGRKQR